MNEPIELNALNSSDTISQGISDYRIYRLIQGVKYINFAFVIFMITIALVIVFLLVFGDVKFPKIVDSIFYLTIILTLILLFLGLVYSLIGINAKRSNMK